MKHSGILLSGFVLLSSVAWCDERVSKLADECRLGEAKSCEDLANTAKSDRNGQARVAAVKALSDLAGRPGVPLLADIAGNTTCPLDARAAALATLSPSAALLTDIAKNDASSLLRLAAVQRISSAYGLLYPEGAAARAALADIAQHAAYPDARAAAVELEAVRDEAIVADIAKNDRDWLPRVAATKRLFSLAVSSASASALLADIAKNDKDWRLRATAVERVSDRATLAEIAKNDRDTIVRGRARARLQPQSQPDKPHSIRKQLEACLYEASCDKLTKTIASTKDETALLEVATGPGVREDLQLRAVERVQGQDILAAVVSKARAPTVQDAAAARLDSAHALLCLKTLGDDRVREIGMLLDRISEVADVRAAFGDEQLSWTTRKLMLLRLPGKDVAMLTTDAPDMSDPLLLVSPDLHTQVDVAMPLFKRSILVGTLSIRGQVVAEAKDGYVAFKTSKGVEVSGLPEDFTRRPATDPYRLPPGLRSATLQFGQRRAQGATVASRSSDPITVAFHAKAGCTYRLVPVVQESAMTWKPSLLEQCASESIAPIPLE